MKKRILTLLTVLVMLFSMTTAFAEEEPNLWAAADDMAKIYVNGDMVVEIKESGSHSSYDTITDYTLTNTDLETPFVAVKAADKSGKHNIAGFKLNLKMSNGDYLVTDNDWYYYYDEDGAPEKDANNNKWYEEDYEGKGWKKVTEISNEDSYWVTEGWNGGRWIWSKNYDYPDADPMDSPIYMRSSKPGTPIKEWTVTFDAVEGAPEPGQQTVDDGGLATEPGDAPEKTGFTFEGWLDQEGILYNFATEVRSDITLTAKWIEKEEPDQEWTVTFDTVGGTPEPGQQTVDDGGLATEPGDAPEKTGFTFEGWLDQEGILYNFATEVKSDITLTAKWIEKEEPDQEWTVTFDTVGGTPEPGQQTVDDGGLAIEPGDAPEKTGFTFEGWLDQEGILYNFETEVRSDITLTAKWIEIEEPESNWTVIFDSTGGSSVDSQTVADGNKASEPTNPTRSGYRFVSWNYGSGVYNFETPVVSDITLTANWNRRSTPSKTEYTLEVAATEGGTVPGYIGTNTYNSGTNVRMSITVEEGYEFTGWTGDTSTMTNNSIRMNGDKSITANFELIIEEEEIPENLPEEEPEEILDEVLPESAVNEVEEEIIDEVLPETAGLPMELFTLLGTSIIGLGVTIKKKK